MGRSKLTEWRLEDYMNSRDDIVEFIRTMLEDMGKPISDIDFEFLMLECTRLPNLAIKKGWIDMKVKKNESK